MNKNSTLHRYIYSTRQPVQSVLFTVPVILCYEMGLFLFTDPETGIIRNGADVLLRYFYSFFGLYGHYAFAFSLFLILLVGFWIEYRRERRLNFRFEYLPGMLFESIVYGVILFFILNQVTAFNIQIGLNGKANIVQGIILIFGAGVYEELLFRVGLVSGFALFLIGILDWNKNSGYILAVIVSAIIFSLFHYIGEFGDIFTMKSFLSRALAGVLLSVLYVVRGFGITVYSHIFYDLIIIFSLLNPPGAGNV